MVNTTNEDHKFQLPFHDDDDDDVGDDYNNDEIDSGHDDNENEDNESMSDNYDKLDKDEINVQNDWNHMMVEYIRMDDENENYVKPVVNEHVLFDYFHSIEESSLEVY